MEVRGEFSSLGLPIGVEDTATWQRGNRVLVKERVDQRLSFEYVIGFSFPLYIQVEIPSKHLNE